MIGSNLVSQVVSDELEISITTLDRNKYLQSCQFIQPGLTGGLIVGLTDLLAPPHRPLVANLLQTLVADPNLLFEHLQRVRCKSFASFMLFNPYHRSVGDMAILLKTLLTLLFL